MDWNTNQAYEPEFQTPLRKDAAYYRNRATKVLKGNYLWAVLAFVIASALGGAASGGVSFSPSVHVSENLPDHSLDSVESFGDLIEAFPIIPILIGVFVLAFAISFVLNVTVFGFALNIPSSLIIASENSSLYCILFCALEFEE